MTDWPRSSGYDATSRARAFTILDLYEPAAPTLKARVSAARVERIGQEVVLAAATISGEMG